MRASTCLALALCTLAGSASAQPGTSLRKFTVPVPTTTCCGIGVAVDCNGFLYYTNTETPTLFKIDANGTLLSSTPIADSTGTP